MGFDGLLPSVGSYMCENAYCNVIVCHFLLHLCLNPRTETPVDVSVSAFIS